MNISHLSFSYGLQKIFVDVSFSLDSKDHVALIGPNGAGKSTFFHLLLKDLEPDYGTITIHRSSRLSYLPQTLQDDLLNMDITVLEYLKTARPFTQLETKLNSLYEEASLKPKESKKIYDDDISTYVNNYYFNDERIIVKNKMGTTFVGACFCEERIYLCNIGDSRAYRVRESQLVQISKDHVEEIPPFMQHKRHIKPNLSQCIGIPSEELLIEPYVMQGEIKQDDTYLLCSDGITDMLTDKEILSILENSKDASICIQLLISSAMSHGGKDNATAIVVKVKEKE